MRRFYAKQSATILSWSICAACFAMAAPSPRWRHPDNTNKQRGDPRVTHYFDAAWFGAGAFDARLSDLSVSGCYIVNRRTTPSIGEIVEIDVVRTAKEPLPLAGEVVSTEPGIGRRPVCWGR